MNSIEKLTEIFSHFPGIGPRQARRFVYYLLHRQNGFSKDLIEAIENIKKEISQCDECMRFYALGQSLTGEAKNGQKSKLCSICTSPNRESELLMIVPRDIDLEAIEKSGSFHGHYFVLGGSLPILEKEPQKRIRIKELKSILNKRVENGLKEIILGMNVNAEGENTAEFIRAELTPLLNKDITISILGRGLSTGTELEYADPETLKNAFIHRTK